MGYRLYSESMGEKQLTLRDLDRSSSSSSPLFNKSLVLGDKIGSGYCLISSTTKAKGIIYQTGTGISVQTRRNASIDIKQKGVFLSTFATLLDSNL